MTVHLKRRDDPCLQRTALLTPDDIAALLAVCRNTRDKAFLSILWESGSRISEPGNLQLKQVTKHEHGYILDLEGKTGRRNPLIVSSSPHLATWLSHHPFKDNQESPLWVHYHALPVQGPPGTD
jgi:integrase